MNLPHRIDLLARLGNYILANEEEWKEAKAKATAENPWFIPEFVELATTTIASSFLQKAALEKWIINSGLFSPSSSKTVSTKEIGLVMAGNIPLVGFHDWLCVFISGHVARVKPSSKDQALIRHLSEKLIEWDADIKNFIRFEDLLRHCDAYIATGSNNSSRYFDYYFGKYPHIIRRNRTSVAVITGTETKEDLERLSDDVYLYFGLGCRNVTKLYVPRQYDFLPMLSAFRKYDGLIEHFKYKNNYDYNLALLLLNKKLYMSNGSVLLVEEPSFFSPISQLNYEFYDDRPTLLGSLRESVELQCIVGKDFVPFGKGQNPELEDYSDGVNTLNFLSGL